MSAIIRASRSLLVTLIVVLTLVYLGACLFVYLSQDRMIFIGASPDHSTYTQYELYQKKLQHQDVVLQGWHIVNEGVESDVVVLWFGGNAEDVALSLDLFSDLNAREVFAFNYRGYGLSEGRPSQQALYADALYIYDHIIKEHKHISANSIVIVGKSLGSAMATYLASKRQSAKVVLITPLKSMKAIAKRLFPYVPATLMLKHPFKIVSLVEDIETPVHMYIAKGDEVIPNEHSLELYERWAGEKQHTIIEGATHNSVVAHPDFVEGIKKILHSL